MKPLRFYFYAALCATALEAQGVQDKVADVFVPPPFAAQHINGMLGERMRINLEGRLLNVDEKAILDCFRHRPGNHPWAGEHAGKFLDAAANAWLYTKDERVKILMDRVAKELMATQLPDGYLGTYSDDKRWTEWDVWVHKYDLIGLLSYYRATGNQQALEASKRIGNLLCRTFGTKPGQRDIIQAGTHVGMAATSVLEPMVYLYRTTGDRKYLEFCEYVVGAWSQPDGPKILESLKETGSVFHTANAKAYEMLSNLVGLAELYRTTGNKAYLSAVETAWNDIAVRRLYVDGTASTAEHFSDDFVLPGEEISNVGEGCVTVTWTQLTWELFRLTGDVRYAEQLEHTVYNALLAAQDPVNGNICYFTPLDGKKNPGPGISCCVSSEPRGISMIPLLTWGNRADGVAILLYTSGHVNVQTQGAKVEIESRTNYPADGAIALTVNPDKKVRFPLSLRVPAWTKTFEATAGGQKYAGKPGQFLTIDREWNAGDQVDIKMDLTVRAVSGAPSYPFGVAIFRGPQLLALEQSANPDVPDLQAAGPASMDVKLSPTANADLLVAKNRTIPSPAYRMDGLVTGKPHGLILVPFADARSYRVWLLKP